jgi:transposase InsO family protein
MRVILSTLMFFLTFRFRRRISLELEVIALRHQLSVLQRRRKLQPLIIPADRFIWCWLYRVHPRALKWMRLVKPETVIEWHRRGFLFYWRSRSNRSHAPWKVKGQLRRLIVQMYNENTGWGAGRIQGELLKLGYNVTKPTIWKYLAIYPLMPSPGWRTFLRNHMHDAAAMDMFVVISLSFRLLYAMVILSLDRRKILHVSATEHPTQEWLSNEVSQTFARNPKPKYLIRDRDSCYGRKFSQQLKELGIREHVIDKQSPWQNIYVERVIGTIRRECLDHIIVISERHLRRILEAYVGYYNRSRVHVSLNQDCPIPRSTQSLHEGRKVVAIPHVGGLHHRYERRAA